jgi:rhamnosyltransferase
LGVVFLIVTYEPNEKSFLEHLARNILASSHIIIVDNSYTIPAISFIRSLSAENLTVIQNLKNLGIAQAQNIGISKFLEMEWDYLLQLDQDSSIGNTAIHLMLDFYELNGSRLQLAGVGPGKIKQAAKKVREIKSSGLLVHRKIIDKVGYLRSDLFIDLVDYEWCWRAGKKHQLTFYEVPCEFLHQLGESYKVLSIFTISIPTPVRHYYQFRNSLNLIFSLTAPLTWSFLRLMILVVKLILYPIILPSGVKRLKYMLFGIIDFTLGKTGEFHYPGYREATRRE